jgi:hypothetical protein
MYRFYYNTFSEVKQSWVRDAHNTELFFNVENEDVQNRLQLMESGLAHRSLIFFSVDRPIKRTKPPFFIFCHSSAAILGERCS